MNQDAFFYCDYLFFLHMDLLLLVTDLIKLKYLKVDLVIFDIYIHVYNYVCISRG